MNSPGTTCFYCGSRRAVDRDAYSCRLYRRKSGWIFVKAEKIDVDIPRCPDCHAIHTRSIWLSALSGYALVLPISVWFLRNGVDDDLWLLSWGFNIFAVVVPGMVVSGLIYILYFGQRLVSKFKMKPEYDVEAHPEVQRQISAGWSLRGPDQGGS